MTRTLAHVSDLHLGGSEWLDARVGELAHALEAAAVDRIVVTGDVTEMGKTHQVERFFSTFGSLISSGRVVVVPGNHDCLGDDVTGALMPGPRVQVEESTALFLVRVNSTGPHNRFLLASHGQLTEDDLDDIDDALATAPAGALRVVALHHHPIPLPTEGIHEAVSDWLGWPHAAEIAAGHRLLARVGRHCDLLLHGHRHSQCESRCKSAPGLRIFNAGCSPALGRVRVFSHQGGRLVGEPHWLRARETVPARVRRPSAWASAWVRGIRSSAAAAATFVSGNLGGLESSAP